MKRKIFTRPVTVTLPDEMFKHIKKITDTENISFSEYIREAIQEKLTSENMTEKENRP
jgi:metal-responsive CopG/Arc/MetJ family transcriptional regulator